MTDEQLLLMYQKYKRRRIIVLILIISIIIISISIYFVISNTSSKIKGEVDNPVNHEIIKDQIAPKIKLSVNNIEVMKGGDIDYLKYIESVIDDTEGDLLDKISYVEIDTSLVGEQNIIYSVSDSSGNTAQEILKVNILETKNPVDEHPNSPSLPKVEEPKYEESKPSNPDSTNNSVPSNKTEVPSSNETPEILPKEKIVKYFLFSDGYTMANVSEVCATELRKTNRTGMCSPIQDQDGIYLGMKLEVE